MARINHRGEVRFRPGDKPKHLDAGPVLPFRSTATSDQILEFEKRDREDGEYYYRHEGEIEFFIDEYDSLFHPSVEVYDGLMTITAQLKPSNSIAVIKRQLSDMIASRRDPIVGTPGFEWGPGSVKLASSKWKIGDLIE